MITRLACLLFAAAIVGAGLAEESLLLVVLGATVVVMAFWGMGSGDPDGWCRASRAPTWAPPHLDQRAVTLGGCALGCGLVAVAFGATTTRVAVPVVAWLLSIGLLVAFGLRLDRLTLADLRSGMRPLWSQRQKPEIGTVLAIVGVALVLRIYDLDAVPAFVHGDEGEMGKIALHYLPATRSRSSRRRPFGGQRTRSTTCRRSCSGCSGRLSQASASSR